MNQIMTDYQRELVVEHLGLIDQVIRKRIRVRGTPLLSYEDFYSVGCEALCDAAMRYRPEEGEFEPYAYVMLYHAMIDHCRKQNRQQSFASDLSVDVDNEAISLEVLSTTDVTTTQVTAARNLLSLISLERALEIQALTLLTVVL